MRARFLRREERSYAQSVFGKSIPLDDILITDAIGSSISPVEPFETPTGRSKYCLSMGKDGFVSCLTVSMKPVFVHCLTHVWQRRFTPSKYRPSCGGQGRQDAEYKVGQAWHEYTPEQQAQMVSDWATDGMLTSDPRAPYISNHIRIGAA